MSKKRGTHGWQTRQTWLYDRKGVILVTTIVTHTSTPSTDNALRKPPNRIREISCAPTVSSVNTSHVIVNNPCHAFFAYFQLYICISQLFMLSIFNARLLTRIFKSVSYLFNTDRSCHQFYSS